MNVAEEIHALVEVRDCVGLVTHEVVESVGAIGVNETVAYPLSCADTGAGLANRWNMESKTCLSLMSVTTSKADSTPSLSTVPA